MKIIQTVTFLFLCTTIVATAGCRQLVPTPQPHTEVREQRLITERADLLDKSGRLAVKGWAPQAMLTYDPARVDEDVDNLREWEFFTVLTEDYVINFTVAEIGFASFCSVDYIDFASGTKKIGFAYEVGTGELIDMTPDNFGRMACTEDGREVMIYEREGDKRVLTFNLEGGIFADDMSGRIELEQKRSMDFMALATPFAESEQMFFYEQKISGMPAAGTAVIDGQTIELPQGKAFAVMDWGRGAWPDKLNWRWGSGSGIIEGKVVSFNIGNGFGDMSAASENLIVYDGVGHKIDRVTWRYDSEDYTKPWQFTSNDGRFEMTLVPVYDQNMDVDMLFKYGVLHKVYGSFSGTLTLDDGRTIAVENMMGFAEEVFISW